MARTLIIADIHANLAALEAVLAAAESFDEVWNLGDTVGYGPDPISVCERVDALKPAVWLAGNHDLAATGDLSLGAFNQSAAEAAVWTSDQLPDRWRNQLRDLPTSGATEIASFAHGSVRDPIWEYVLTEESALACLSATTTGLVVVGHSHVALRASIDIRRQRVSLARSEAGTLLNIGGDRWLINPGSVGQPRDGDPRAAYALLDRKAARVSFHRVPYDIARTQR
ncbi:MAG: metallophosphoesterase family protein, partial [Chloroflexia bacterium]|nr:metallophosphoesterase family protein [Chloroflexia bacterium]